jgi:hypothetical protein
MCEEMELENGEAKDFVQRERSQWKELARHPDQDELIDYFKPDLYRVKSRTRPRWRNTEEV